MKYILKMIVRTSSNNETFVVKESSYEVLTEMRDNLVRLYSYSVSHECMFKFEYIKHTEEGNKQYLTCYSPELLKLSRIDFVIIES